MKIQHLRKEDYKDYILPIGYTTDSYYQVEEIKSEGGFGFAITKKEAETPIVHTPEEYDYPDRLYEDYRDNAYAWGILEDGQLIAAIETMPEDWSNRLIITELWVAETYQKQGYGKALMNVVKEQARQERRRAIILETQSCNANAIDFYLHEGFCPIGLDTCCYQNHDIERNEVRIDMGYFVPRKHGIDKNEIEIRKELPADYEDAERMTQEAFWNKHQPGCDEHYLVHKLRKDKNYVPELSRIAVKDGKVIGGIWYAKAKVVSDEEESFEVLTFGPLCISPEWQGTGVGGYLLDETIKLAKEKGYPGIVIFGEPDYYPRHGFVTCDHLGITAEDGTNSDPFMGYVLDQEQMGLIHGKFYEGKVYEDLPKDEVEHYNHKFPFMEKQRFPSQWIKD